MATKTAYDDLPLLPWFMAQTVCQRPYTGNEMNSAYNHRFIEQIEEMRKKMTTTDILMFCEETDQRCREAYRVKGNNFFKKCVRDGNVGRDQLLNVWIPHWLCAHLAKKGSIFP